MQPELSMWPLTACISERPLKRFKYACFTVDSGRVYCQVQVCSFWKCRRSAAKLRVRANLWLKKASVSISVTAADESSATRRKWRK